jgi:hypothetical protein
MDGWREGGREIERACVCEREGNRETLSSEAVSGTAFPAGSALGAESHSYPRQDTVGHTFSTHLLLL